MRAKRIIAALMLLAAACFGARAQERKDDDGVPTVAYCDLLRDPASYDLKVIRVKVMYMSAFEGSSMYDLACERKDSWVVFDKEVETSTDRKLLKKFRRLSDASPVKTRKGIDHPVRIVEAVWVGMF